MSEQPSKPSGYEKRDISVAAVAWFAVGLLVSAVVIHFAVAWLFDAFGRQYPSPESPSRIATAPPRMAPPPQLQRNPAADLQQYQAAESLKLNSYGWINKEAGVVRLPIARAMELIAQRGLPERKPGSQNSSGKTPVDMQRQKALRP